MENKKIILITGTSSGFGQLTAKALAEQGHKVYASMRDIATKNKESAQDLQTWAEEKNFFLKVIEIDLKSEDSIQKAVDKILEEEGTIDILINNAGSGALGLQENFTAQDWQQIFDVNVFGVQRMNRAVLPHMREKQQGLIIYVSSLLGRIVMPTYGPYTASKWALESLAETYRVELSQFGIQSCIVEPGAFPTTFMDKLLRASDKSRNESYAEFASVPEQSLENLQTTLATNPAQNPNIVAEAILNLIQMPVQERPFRTTVDNTGLGANIKPYNEELEKIMTKMYTAFHMGTLLKLKEEK
ncbi:SDR family oxidoreductase [Candidatus Woesearchaeota archaeon]|nr:SDR family oxidoreductase [Candidatus Woesearchaeota archaeon]USN43988.1 MAG: SDR family oxidoreductase [Candidatus Woesearchaeota archaeon]